MAGKGRVSIETPKQRFNKKYLINEVTDCWEWTAAFNNIGYGMFRWATNKMRSAHRASYELFNGPIPEGMIVCHSCDNPKCVNPKHLWAGTHRDNYNDMMAKGRNNYIKVGGNQPKATCKYCGVEQPVNTLARYHNDKCKNKP